MNEQLTVLGELIRARDMRYARFAREFARVAGERRLGVTAPGRKQFDRWRRHGRLKTLPHEESCLVLEHMFPGMTASRLFAPAPSEHRAAAGQKRAERRGDEKPPQPREAAMPVPAVLDEEDDVNRRTLLRGLTAGTALGITPDAAQAMSLARQRMDRTLERATVSTATLERWEITAYDYARSYQSVPPQQLLGDALADILEVHRLLDGPHPSEHRRRLCRVAAQLAALCGVFSSALGDHREARNWFHTGRLAAHEAGDTQLAGNLQVRSAIVSLYYGAPVRAHEQAVAAQQTAGRSYGPALARALIIQARALARLERQDEALAAIRQAEDVFSRLSDEHRGDLVLGYTERQFLFTMGNALTHLGRCAEARAVQRRALGAYPAGEYLDPTLIRLDQAVCLAKDGEPEEAYRLAGRTLRAVPAEHRTGMVIKYAEDFTRISRTLHPSLPVGEEVAELLRA